MNPAVQQDLETCIREAIVQTLEELGFLFAMEAEAGEETGTDGIAVEVGFHGPLAGAVRLEMSAAVLPVLAANMLAMDGEPGRVLQMDALGELANIVCGNVLPALAGPRAVFNLDQPRVVTGPLQGEPVAGSLVMLDRGWAEARLVVYAAPPQP